MSSPETNSVEATNTGIRDTKTANVPAPRWLPGMFCVVLYWLVVQSVQRFGDSNFLIFMTQFIGPLVTALLFFIAWLGFSRRSWSERGFGMAMFIVTGALAAGLAHSTMKVGLILYALPTLLTTWAVWGWLTRLQASLGHRRVTLALTMLMTASYFCMLRLNGVDGAMQSSLSWRWTPTAEEKFLETVSRKSEPTSSDKESNGPSIVEVVEQPGDWIGFRGPNRDGILRGVSIETDWDAHPPKLEWKHAIGPGWSSFAVVGGRLLTQEQRGDDECVTCYDAATGNELWCHRDATRFSEPVAGAGPRGTPQFHDGKLFAQGASGHLVCLDAATGKRLWMADVKADSKAETPNWGFSGSPLIIEDIVTLMPGGSDGASVLGYRVADGELAWKGGTGTSGYISAQLFELHGHKLLISLTGDGATALDPATGRSVWHHSWISEQEFRISQPMLVDQSRLLIPTGQALGSRLINVTLTGDQWETSEVWNSKDLRPYFNDYVQHAGHVFGFDGALFCCVDLTTGKRVWKKGRYGHGQVILLADQGLLLVLSETGDIVLLEANFKSHVELAKIPAIEGKTWNHPVLVRDRLFIRNGEQIACFGLTMSSSATKRGTQP